MVKKQTKRFSKVLAVLMTALMLTGMLPATAFADDSSTQQVRVIVENNIWTAEDGAPWDGQLIDTYVSLNKDTTMMSALAEALKAKGKTQKGAETNSLSEINGLANGAAGADCKWKGSVNDEDVNQQFADYAVSKGNLSNGTVIRMTYDGTVTVKKEEPKTEGTTGSGSKDPANSEDEDSDPDSDSDTAKNPDNQSGNVTEDTTNQDPAKEKTAEDEEDVPSLTEASPLRNTSVAASMMALRRSMDPHEHQVRVIVENTTFLEATSDSDYTEPAWTGTLVDTWVDLDDESTMMSCVVAALDTVGATQEGAENNYIEDINGLAAFDGGYMSGWMGTLNDWFTNEGFGGFTVANGKLEAGDEIRIMYTTNGYGEDLGGSWSNNDKTVKNVTFDVGTLDKAFDANTYVYVLTVPSGTEGVIVTPTATNKNYQVRTSVSGREYKRTAKVPVEKGTEIQVACGDPSWPSMNDTSGPGEGYIFKVDFENGKPTIKDDVSKSVSKKISLGESYTVDLSTIFEDPEEDQMTYSVAINGGTAVKAQEAYSFTPDQEGTYTLVFKANDGTNESTDTYTVTLTAAMETVKLESLIVHTGTSPSASNVLLRNGTDSYTTENIFDTDTLEYQLADQTDSLTQLRFRAKATDPDAKVTIYYYGEGSKEITWSNGSSKFANCLTAGKNTFTIAVEPKDSTTQKGTTYTFQVNCMPTLTGLSVASGDTQLYLDQTFSATLNDYTMSVPETAEKVTVEATPRGSTYQVLYNGEETNTVDIKGKDEITVDVSAGEGADKITNSYTIKLNKVKQLDFSVKTAPTDAIVKVYDQKGANVEANQDGSFSGMFAEYEYTYTVTRYGYVGQSNTVPAEGGQIDVTLEKAPDDGLNEVSSDWENFRNSDTNMAITDAQTPTSLEDTSLLWSAKLGSGWSAAPSVQIIADDSLIVMSGTNIYKLDLKSGEIMKTGTMSAAPNYGYTPPIYAEGMIICPLANGTIQAFNAETLESLWIYKDNLKGQSLSPITYSDGYIYTGFWNGEINQANYVCISITDEDPSKTDETKLATWKHTQAGGFYWAGSVVVGNVTIVGTDDGASGSKGNAQLYAFNKTTGEIISSIDLESVGDQRSSIAYDKASGKIYFTTKGGYLCSAKVDASTGVISDLKKVNYNAQSTSTPVVYKGKVYFATGSGISTTGSSGNVVVADAESLEMLYAIGMKGYPQCSLLLSTAYEDETGYIYLYSTYNANPGGISMIKVKPTATTASEAELIELYDAKGFEQYCITSIICGADGTLYYKNDSGNVFAVGVPDYKTVINLINKIGTVSLNSGSDIDTARKAYEALDDNKKSEITNYDTLTAAEKKYSELRVAESSRLIDEIGTVTLNKEKAINEARSFYDSLTKDEKTLITNYSTLTAAEKRLAELKAEEAAKENQSSSGSASTGTTAGGKTASVGTAGGGTVSIGDGLVPLASATAEAKAVISKIDAIIAPSDAAAKLPEDVKDITDEQMQSLLDVYKEYEALSEAEKQAVKHSDNYQAFEKILNKIGEMNHYDEPTGTDLRDNDEEVLPWYIKLTVKPQELTEDQEADLTDVLGEENEIFTMNDISLTSMMDESEWHPEELVKVKLPMVELGDYKSAIVVHITDDGKIQLIEGKESEGNMVFETESFSLYGIAGSMQSVDDLLGAQTMKGVLPWIIIGAIALIALIAILYIRRRKRHTA